MTVTSNVRGPQGYTGRYRSVVYLNYNNNYFEALVTLPIVCTEHKRKDTINHSLKHFSIKDRNSY